MDMMIIQRHYGSSSYRFLDKRDESVTFRLQSLRVSYHTAVSEIKKKIKETIK